MTLEPIPATECPDCGSILDVYRWDQLALFVAAGYGAASRTTLRACPDCPWVLVAEKGDVRP